MFGRSASDACTPASTANMESLWTRYKLERGVAERNSLAQAYGGFARMMAAKAYARRTSPDLEFDDYLQYAQVGLIESIERFDPARGAKFETYAAIRIGGAILNGLESASELHEQLAARRRLLAERTDALRAEAAAALGGDVFDQLADIAMGLAVGFMLEGSGMYQDGDAGTVDNTYAGLELRQARRQLHEALEGLPERLRRVVSAHYLQHQPFEEIAVVLNLSRGRVSQLHKEALAKLGELLQKANEVDFRC